MCEPKSTRAARARGDAGLSNPARAEQGMGGAERYGGGRAGAVDYAVLDGGQGRGRRQLSAHPGSARWIERLAQSSLGKGAGSAAPLGHSCSHAPFTAFTAKSTCINSYLAPGSVCRKE